MGEQSSAGAESPPTMHHNYSPAEWRSHYRDKIVKAETTLGKTTARHAVEVGTWLVEAKAKVFGDDRNESTGTWTQFCGECGISRGHADNYMKLKRAGLTAEQIEEQGGIAKALANLRSLSGAAVESFTGRLNTIEKRDWLKFYDKVQAESDRRESKR